MPAARIAPPVHFQNLETGSFELNSIANAGDATKAMVDEPSKSDVVAGGKWIVQLVLQFRHPNIGADLVSMRIFAFDVAMSWRKLIFIAADNLFEDIFERYQALGTAVFIQHDGNLPSVAGEVHE